MPPKIKVSKEDIIKAAVDIVRNKGAGSLNARSLASELGCSTQPIFSNYANMDELKAEVIRNAKALYQGCVDREVSSGKYLPYKAVGMGYISFAKEEKELFKLLFMRDRSGESREAETEFTYVIPIIQKNTGLSHEDATLFHLEMWIYVHGIATMLATSYLSLDGELISRILTDAYDGLKKRFISKEESK